MKRISPITTLFSIGLLLLVGISGCTGEPSNADSSSSADSSPAANTGESIKNPYQIVTTCVMVTDIVEQVAGDKAKVSGIMGEGVDPHLYKPTRNDVTKLLQADVIFYSGLLLEGKMTVAFEQAGNQEISVHAVTAVIERSYLREPPEFEGHPDPHVWMDVSAWSQCVGGIAESLSKFDPDNAEAYQSNAKGYQKQLKELDDYVKKVIATIPKEQRVLVTAHDAFGYFSRAYGIEIRSVQGLSTESAAGLRDIEDLVKFIVKRKVSAIFVETSVSEKNIQALVEGAEKKGWKVRIGGSLYSDAMGAPGTYEGTYIGMLDHDATIITRALGGTAPEKGMNGKLRSAPQKE